MQYRAGITCPSNTFSFYPIKGSRVHLSSRIYIIVVVRRLNPKDVWRLPNPHYAVREICVLVRNQSGMNISKCCFCRNRAVTAHRYHRHSQAIALFNYHISRKLKTCPAARISRTHRMPRERIFIRVVLWILTIHVHANRRRQRNRPIVIRGVADQHRVDVVPTQVLYNDLAACHVAARRRGPIGDESVVAIPGHHRGRFTWGVAETRRFRFSFLREKKIRRYRRIATFRRRSLRRKVKARGD